VKEAVPFLLLEERLEGAGGADAAALLRAEVDFLAAFSGEEVADLLHERGRGLVGCDVALRLDFDGHEVADEVNLVGEKVDGGGVVEHFVVDEIYNLLAVITHAANSDGGVSGGAEAHLRAVGGAVEQLGGDVGEDGGRLLRDGGIAQCLQQVSRDAGRGASVRACLSIYGQKGAEIILEELFYFLVQRRAVLEQLLQLVDGELARGAPAQAPSHAATAGTCGVNKLDWVAASADGEFGSRNLEDVRGKW
jgi:hypothetical protein